MGDSDKPQIFIVDVCGTLVRDDTTLGMLHHHFKKDTQRKIRYFIFNSITVKRRPLNFILVVLEKVTSRHILKHLVVRMLAGEKVEELNKSAKEYADYLLKERLVPEVWLLIEAALKSEQVILASASLEPIVSSLASSIGSRYVASILEQEGGVLTGRYNTDLTGCKEQAIIQKFGPTTLAGKVCTISDNYTDRELLEKAAIPYVILHSELHRKRWHGLDATYVRVSV